MVTTNRQFDDDKVLTGVAKLKGLALGDYLPFTDVSVLYDAPFENGIETVTVEATSRWSITPQEARDILNSSEA
jgi:hypothetical protein